MIFVQLLHEFWDFLTIFWEILEFFVLSSAKKIGRPIIAYLPTYYVRFSSYHARPTYLPKIGRH